MRKVKIEVKTVYEIRFNFHDFCEIYEKAKEDPVRLSAFDNFDLDDTTMGNLRKCFESLGRLSWFMSSEDTKQNCENLKYIVNKLGFSGVENYGGLYGDKKEYSITVYNYGADI